jgi:hypothetical protein
MVDFHRTQDPQRRLDRREIRQCSISSQRTPGQRFHARRVHRRCGFPSSCEEGQKVPAGGGFDGPAC